MNNRILIAFNESESAKRAVLFAADHFKKDHDITLFHVVPDTAAACGLNSPSLTPYFEKERSTFCGMEEQRKFIVSDMLEDARTSLRSRGFADESITVKIQAQKDSIPSDIVNETKKEYGMIIMGRHSSSGIKDFFMGSTVQKVLHAVSKIPVIIID